MKITITLGDGLPAQDTADLLNTIWKVTRDATRKAGTHFKGRHDGGDALSELANDTWDEDGRNRWQ
jgi:hypothetical protein